MPYDGLVSGQQLCLARHLIAASADEKMNESAMGQTDTAPMGSDKGLDSAACSKLKGEDEGWHLNDQKAV